MLTLLATGPAHFVLLFGHLIIFGTTKVSCEFVARLPQTFGSDQTTVPFFPTL